MSLPKTSDHTDIEVPMVPCPRNNLNDNGWSMSATMWCPKFKETDILRGSFYSTKYSWLRLAVHRCDPNETIIKNGKKQKKKCASKDEQNKYFQSTILSLLINKQEPDLETRSHVHVKKMNKDEYYSVKTTPHLAEFKEIWLEKSTIKLDNDRTGLLDNSEEKTVI